ncbi:MAG: mannonate dehydratase [Chloroflexota bacterium]|nr:mannonate dehydratase [Chloroflexota bacterium]MDE2839902.1 mannonate dehydratase [Chloroflexota bacterium]MDE2931651.1 mannonate dehydratase [Chloroflexota bacterium]
MKLGVRVNRNTLDNRGDDYLRFLQQIGVDCIDIELGLVAGYNETGCFSREALHALVARSAAFDLRIERANAINSQHLDALIGGPNAAEQRDHLCTMAELLGEVGVPVFGVQCYQAASAATGGGTGRSHPEGRGGYRYYHFDLAAEEAAQGAPRFTVTADQLWENLLLTYKQVIPVAESANINVAMHGNDPPLYELYGNPQIMCRFADFDRLFSEVPSAHNTMTFCVGTRYESGEDIFDGIRHFGGQGKIAHVHFRNVRGTLPANGSYSEVFLDEGDMHMQRVVEALHGVNYQGAIDFDHVMQISGDTANGHQYVAYSVGYVRALLQGLGNAQ